MKITCTQQGRCILQDYFEDIKSTRNDNFTQSRSNINFQYHTAYLPAVPILVKRPKIKISDEFKLKYAMNNTISQISLSHASSSRNHGITLALTSRNITTKSIQMKQEINNIENTRIMANIRKRIALNKAKRDREIINNHQQFQKELTSFEHYFSHKVVIDRRKKLRAIHQKRYGLWNTSPRDSILAVPKNVKTKYRANITDCMLQTNQVKLIK